MVALPPPVTPVRPSNTGTDGPQHHPVWYWMYNNIREQFRRGISFFEGGLNKKTTRTLFPAPAGGSAEAQRRRRGLAVKHNIELDFIERLTAHCLVQVCNLHRNHSCKLSPQIRYLRSMKLDLFPLRVTFQAENHLTQRNNYTFFPSPLTGEGGETRLVAVLQMAIKSRPNNSGRPNIKPQLSPAYTLPSTNRFNRSENFAGSLGISPSRISA